MPSPSSTSSSSSTSAPLPTSKTTSDDLDSKRSWLHLLPHEQVVSIVLRLDEYAPPDVKSEIWPSDIKAAVRTLSEQGKGEGKEVSNVDAPGSDSVAEDAGVTSPSEVQAAEASDRQDSPSTDVDETPATTTAAMGVQQVPVVSLPPPTSTATSPTLPNGLLVGSPAPTAASPTSLPVPPLAPPPPGVNTGIAPGIQGHMPYPYAVYPTYAGANPSYPFNIQSLLPPAQNVQKPQQLSQHPPPPHPFPFGPLSIPLPPPGSLGPPQPQPPPNNGPFTRAPLPPPARTVIPPRANIPPHPQPKGPSAEDLPSYEEMIVQALIDLGATDANAASEGVVPKQVFQWMAERYPLQQNFRPSASQALQKAYKRGRFEKNRDGRYRLNLYWEGANVSYFLLLLVTVDLKISCSPRLLNERLADHNHNSKQRRIHIHLHIPHRPNTLIPILVMAGFLLQAVLTEHPLKMVRIHQRHRHRMVCLLATKRCKGKITTRNLLGRLGRPRRISYRPSISLLFCNRPRHRLRRRRRMLPLSQHRMGLHLRSRLRRLHPLIIRKLLRQRRRRR